VSRAIEQVYRDRDRHLRRRLLQSLHAVRADAEGGWANGRWITNIVAASLSPAYEFEGANHRLKLLHDLVNKGLVEPRDDRKYDDEPYAIDYLSFRITDHGSRLVNETAPPDPDIEDPRRPRSL